VEGSPWMKKEKTEWKQNTLNGDDLRKESFGERKNPINTLVQTEETNLIMKYSSLTKLLRITAYVVRWEHRVVNS